MGEDEATERNPEIRGAIVAALRAPRECRERELYLAEAAWTLSDPEAPAWHPERAAMLEQRDEANRAASRKRGAGRKPTQTDALAERLRRAIAAGRVTLDECCDHPSKWAGNFSVPYGTFKSALDILLKETCRTE